jgi:putative component of toxin-antitoxin plasmid stabilization module
VIELVYYQEEGGRSPFIEWITSLRDKIAKARIAADCDRSNPAISATRSQWVRE